MVAGAACSQVFSGKNLAAVLEEGYQLETDAMEAMREGRPAPPLCVHTSAGSPPALSRFIDAIGKHSPWNSVGGHDNGREDWFLTLQVEGSSAVWPRMPFRCTIRGCPHRDRIAVADVSYHGPQSMSLGSGFPLPSLKPADQLRYPSPAVQNQREDEDQEAFHARCLAEFGDFLARHGETIGVLLFEPQWGSSACAQPWPRDLLQQYCQMAKDHGILLCSDEIMCGLGRHGQGPAAFLSAAECWDLDPDAVTFGKALGGGVYPIAGALIKSGSRAFREENKSVLQSHTYSASSTRALLTGIHVLENLPNHYGHVKKMGDLCAEIFNDMAHASRGELLVHGQGLMWGGLYQGDQESLADRFRRNCGSRDGGVWPYFVGDRGFMITLPLMFVRKKCQ